MRHSAEYFREYRRRNLEKMRTYSRERWRFLYGGMPRWNHFRFADRPSERQTAFYSKDRLEHLEKIYKIIDEIEIEKAMLNPELAELIKAQAKDSKSFEIKHDLSYDENAPLWERHTVRSDYFSG